jgi:NAD kinase
MKSFYIVTNTTKDPDLVYTNSILDYLNKHNVSCIYNPDSADVEHTDYCYTNADIVPDDTECIIVLGGDGYLLKTIGGPFSRIGFKYSKWDKFGKTKDLKKLKINLNI